jgi:hypothetical protein
MRTAGSQRLCSEALDPAQSPDALRQPAAPRPGPQVAVGADNIRRRAARSGPKDLPSHWHGTAGPTRHSQLEHHLVDGVDPVHPEVVTNQSASVGEQAPEGASPTGRRHIWPGRSTLGRSRSSARGCCARRPRRGRAALIREGSRCPGLADGAICGASLGERPGSGVGGCGSVIAHNLGSAGCRRTDPRPMSSSGTRQRGAVAGGHRNVDPPLAVRKRLHRDRLGSGAGLVR